ncbi:MAG: alpha/beta hydrolase [Acidobacteriota bacterium]|nr:alpha/beta hydrolase [Acidobacteriota bacterium]
MQKVPHSPTRSTPRSLKLHRSIVGPRDASPILVLHGITGSRRYWLPRVLPLARRNRLIVPDLPGFGLSPKPFADYTPEFFVETLIGLLEHEGIAGTPVRVLAHSLGALLGLELAARYPARISRLTLLNVPRMTDSKEAHRIWFEGSAQYRNLLMANSFAHNLTQMRRTPLKLTARYMRRFPWAVMADCRRFTFRSLTSTLENCLLNYRVDEVLEGVPKIPVLMIQGDADQVAPLPSAREMASRHPYPSMHVVRGAGHHPIHTHTDLCLRLIAAHLEGENYPALDDEEGVISIPPTRRIVSRPTARGGHPTP